MAKSKGNDGESTSAVFKRLYESDLDSLRRASNDEVYAAFQKEFPNRELDQSVRQVAANVKSKLRKKHGIAGRRGRRKKRAAAAAAAAAQGRVSATMRATPATLALEEGVDECLYQARRIGGEELSDVVKHLHRARNLLIIKNGVR